MHGLLKVQTPVSHHVIKALTQYTLHVHNGRSKHHLPVEGHYKGR